MLALAFPATPALLGLWVVFNRRRVVNGLQTLIAKGRKKKNRSALDGNYGPVKDELFMERLVTQGAVPLELDGTYLRNGSNPYYDPYAGYHWFEGDGMVHACTFQNGVVTYCNRFVVTSRLQQEIKYGKPLFGKFGDQEGVRGVVVALLELFKQKIGATNVKNGDGTANTSLCYHAGQLLALHEGDLPYHLRLLCSGLLETLGRLAVKDWNHNFTAHPKLDAATGHLYIQGYKIDRPEVTVGELDPKGALSSKVTVPLTWCCMMHDMAITATRVVLLQFPLVFDPQLMVKNNSLPIAFKPELPTRVGLLPKGATSPDQVTWYELPSFMAFHVANAWEEQQGRLVKIYLCAAKSVDLAADHFDDSYGAKLSELTIDTVTGEVSLRKVSSVSGEFPIVHPDLQGRPCRYVYTGANRVSDPKGRFGGLAKYDLSKIEGTSGDVESCSVQVTFNDNCFGGEPMFVPRYPDASKCAGEDDGFVLVFVTDEAATPAVTHLHVYDATSPSQQPLTRIAMPQRVPYGFHGMWVTRAQLRAQAALATSTAALDPVRAK